ncbi:MAG: antibiotic biosynthesis monooxygenase [Chloroflexi bacterium]|nr:antibiotic biosynthesis monooxygenase [Chloroflexota bacterium]
MASVSYLRFTIRPERAAAFEAALDEMAAVARQTPGLHWVEVSRFLADPHVYLVLSEWESDAHLDAFDRNPLHSRAIHEQRPSFAAPMVVRRFGSPAAAALTSDDVWAKIKGL